MAKKRSVKHVKNIIGGSFRAMIQQARIDELVTRDIFAGLKWPKWTPPKPDPFTLEEQQRILAWFKAHRFGFHPGPGSTSLRYRPHPSYHAFLHLLFTTGLRGRRNALRALTREKVISSPGRTRTSNGSSDRYVGNVSTTSSRSTNLSCCARFVAT